MENLKIDLKQALEHEFSKRFYSRTEISGMYTTARYANRFINQTQSELNREMNRELEFNMKDRSEFINWRRKKKNNN